VRGLRLGPVSLSEVDASVYDTAPADPSKRGVRLTIRGGVTSSLSFSVENGGAVNPFTTGRVVIPDASQVVTTVHGLRLRAGRIEARLCDRNAGSRGNLLLRICRVALEQGTGDHAAQVSVGHATSETPPCTRGRSSGGATAATKDGGDCGDGLCGAGETAVADTEGPGGLWITRGGVPPELDLLPGERLRDLSALGETRGDDEEGDDSSDGENSDESSGDGAVCMATGVGTAAAVVGPDAGRAVSASDATVGRGHRKANNVGGGGGGGGGGDSNITNDSFEDGISDEGDGEGGMWDSRLDAMTRAAWLGSKQATCRALNSNASTLSAASSGKVGLPSSLVATGSALPTGIAGDGAIAAATDASTPASTGRVMTAESGADVPAEDIRRPFSSSRCAAGPSKPPEIPPRIGSPASSGAGATVAAAGSTSGIERAKGRRSVGSTSGGGGGGSIHGNDRVAGSGFLYRVVVDGLNILITLKLRDSLLLLAQSGLDVAMAALPELSKPSKALLAKELEGEIRGEVNRRTSLDLKQFIDK
ncbi:unnamed protein product, partial [Sphacelaria rigidula]